MSFAEQNVSHKLSSWFIPFKLHFKLGKCLFYYLMYCLYSFFLLQCPLDENCQQYLILLMWKTHFQGAVGKGKKKRNDFVPPINLVWVLLRLWNNKTYLFILTKKVSFLVLFIFFIYFLLSLQWLDIISNFAKIIHTAYENPIPQSTPHLFQRSN